MIPRLFLKFRGFVTMIVLEGFCIRVNRAQVSGRNNDIKDPHNSIPGLNRLGK